MTLSIWFRFTVVAGFAGLAGHYFYERNIGGITLERLLRGGECYVLSTVIAADAFGRWFRAMKYNKQGWTAKPPNRYSDWGATLCFFTALGGIFLYMSNIVSGRGSEIAPPTLLQDSASILFVAFIGGALAVTAEA